MLVEKPYKPKKDSDELAERLKRYSEDYAWIQNNYKRLAEEYPESFVAVRDKEVFFTAPSMKEIVTKITEDGKDVIEYVIEYVTTEKASFIF